MTPDQILAFVATMLAGPATDGFPALTAGGHDPRYPVRIETCSAIPPALDVEGSTFVCGEVSVPENYDRPDGRRIGLKFAVMKARSQSPQKDALIYLHGGPAGRAVPDAAGYDDLFARFREERDIVLFDQRASGISDATVTCFNTLADNLFVLAGKEESKADPVKTCLSELKESGVDLAAYNTTSNAHDVRAIMSALGYPVYNVYGASYGTMLAQELMRADPGGLRAVILDSVAPVFGHSYDGNELTVDKTIGSLVDQCMTDAACKGTYPNLEADMRGLGEKLKANPIPATSTRPEINLAALQDLWNQRNRGQLPGIDPFLPKILTEWASGQSKTYDLFKLGVLTRPLTSAGIAMSYKGKVDAVRLSAGYSAALQAEQMRSLVESVKATTNLLQKETAHPTLDTGLEARLDARLSALAVRLDRDTLLQMGRDYARFASHTPTRGEISDWAVRYFSGADLNEVNTMIAAMTDADLTAFQKRAEQDTGKYFDKLATGAFELAIYACQESVPWNSRAGYEAIKKTYRFPWADDGEMGAFYDLCDAFEHHERPGFHDPVTSDLPVLALQGLADTQTDMDGGTQVAGYLKNAQVVTFPQTGHGVISRPCSRDIMAAFLDHPDQQADASCADTLKVKFVTN